MAWRVVGDSIENGDGFPIVRRADDPDLWPIFVQIAGLDEDTLANVAMMVEARRIEEGYDPDLEVIHRATEMLDFAWQEMGS